MKRMLISALVGAIIIFVFQALSWMALPIHKNMSKYTDKQADIVNALNASITEEGVYDIPGLPPNSDNAAMEKHYTDMIGKPYARVFYYKSFDMNMGAAMSTGFLINFIAMFIISWILCMGWETFRSFKNCFFATAGIFIFAMLQVRLNDRNWWHTPMHYLSGELIDMIIMALLAGLWMGWYWSRPEKNRA